MTPKKTTPLVLMIFTLICALPVAAGAVPTAIAQVDEDDASLLDDENLASGIVSDVLDGGSGDNDDNEEENDDGGAAAGGDTNTQAAVPITDQDQEAANLALNEGVDVDVVQKETRTTPTPSEGEEEPPEFVAFCLEITNPEEEVISDILCFDTSEECAEAQEFLEDRGFVISMECERVETFPPGALECFVIRDNQGEIVAVGCP
jgi:hypothetical protein